MRIGGKLPRWAILSLGLLVGGALVIAAPYWPWDWVKDLSKGFGEALAVFAFLGFTVERWFRQEFAEDVFRAGLGSVLRPEFKDEMQWLTSFNWLAIKSLCHVKLEEVGDDIVKLTLTINREIENISSHSQKAKAAVGVDEWGFSGFKSSIEVCGIQKIGGPKIMAEKQDDPHPSHIGASSREITIDPGGRFQSFSRSIEYRRRNDIAILTLGNPSKDPEIELEAPPSLVAEAGFTHRGKMDAEAFTGKKTLRGTHLPSQLMIVRWWPKA
jgi:hypothetical protein